MGKLLVVDDDEMMRVCVSAMLTARGYDVIEAKDGLEALLVYRTQSSDISLIIMDIVMPRMGGIAATNVIKECNPSIKIILMSGHSECDLSEVKADAFLHKPFSGKTLKELVEQILRGDGRTVPLAIDL